MLTHLTWSEPHRSVIQSLPPSPLEHFYYYSCDSSSSVINDIHRQMVYSILILRLILIYILFNIFV